MNQLKNRNYQGLQLNPAPIGEHMGQGVAYSTSGHNLQYNPKQWDYLYNKQPGEGGPQYVVQGTPVPLGYEETKANLPDESMFIFQKNVAHPNCCPSTYSTSKGCVCTSSQQRWNLSYTRGGGNTTPTYPYI